MEISQFIATIQNKIEQSRPKKSRCRQAFVISDFMACFHLLFYWDRMVNLFARLSYYKHEICPHNLRKMKVIKTSLNLFLLLCVSNAPMNISGREPGSSPSKQAIGMGHRTDLNKASETSRVDSQVSRSLYRQQKSLYTKKTSGCNLKFPLVIFKAFYGLGQYVNCQCFLYCIIFFSLLFPIIPFKLHQFSYIRALKSM